MERTRKRPPHQFTPRTIALMIAIAVVVAVLHFANREEHVLAGQASVIDGDMI